MSTDVVAGLWTVDEFVAGCGGQLDGMVGQEIRAVSMDSRTVQPGDAFFAIRGERFDGHDFVGDAFTRGCAVAVVADGFEGAGTPGALLRVDEPLAAMRRLAEAARRRSQARVIAVTGSVGKTGTKRALELAFAESGSTHASPASFNNHWGVPFTLANLPRDADYAVFEIGMNHAGEITPLAKLVRPHVAVITTIAPVHIGHLGSIEAIVEAKAEIFSGLERDGVAVLNRDNDQYPRLAAAADKVGARIISFGAHDEADARLVRLVALAEGTVVEADIVGDEVTYKLPAPGRHLVINSLAVLAAVKLAGGDLALGALALTDWMPARGRGQRVSIQLAGGEAMLIDESYNANPESMRAALAVLGATEPGRMGRRIAVLGDMLELGDFGEQAHRELADAVLAEGTDLVFACGSMMRNLHEALPREVRGDYRQTAEELADSLETVIGPGDVVMVKGSFAVGMGGIVESLKARSGDSARGED